MFGTKAIPYPQRSGMTWQERKLISAYFPSFAVDYAVTCTPAKKHIYVSRQDLELPSP